MQVLFFAEITSNRRKMLLQTRASSMLEVYGNNMCNLKDQIPQLNKERKENHAK